MRICLINPSEVSLRGKKQYSYPPLGLAYLVGYLRKYYKKFEDLEIKIFDENIEKSIIKKIENFNPDLIGFTATVTQLPRVIEIAKEFPNTPKIIGGPHITTLPHLPKEINIGVVGEGEITFLTLVKMFHKKNYFTKSLKNVKGIIFRHKQKEFFTGTRKYIKNLDTIPFPARDYLKMKKYIKPQMVIRGIIRRTTHMYTSRGCPYKCVFCSNPWKGIRFFSPEYVVAEIEEIVNNYNVDAIYFYDDLFCANKERVKKICELIKKKKLHKKIVFSCQLRANLVDEKLIKMLVSANFVQAEFGFESGSDKILRFLKRKVCY
jgi:radical SAM superfamily enzyme YgiQ (UPF0313 family)